MSRCRDLRPWLHRDADALGEADRLVLEDHLATCAACRGDRDRLQLVRRLGGDLPATSIGPRGVQRAIARALLDRPAREPVRRRMRPWAIAVAAVVIAAGAAVAATAVGRWIDRSSSETEPRPPAPGPSDRDDHARRPAPPDRTPQPPAPPAPGPTEPPAIADPPSPPAAVDDVTAAAWLVRARRQFAARDYRKAERSAAAALDAGPDRAETAEALMIAADCAQARGTLDDAAERYAAIAIRYADLDAGETALFAAARLETRRGRPAAARLLLERYLDRYPSGRFAPDARRELEP
jgi:hypothetical protein